jgi:hypothetical protein
MFGQTFLFPLLAAGVLIAAPVTPNAAAQPPVARTAYLTFSAPVTLPGASLGTGTYMFELADPLGDISIVRVSSRDGSKIYYTGFTELVPRPRGHSDGLVSLGEAPAGMPVPITVWYPRDDPSGRKFVYSDSARTSAARTIATK